MAALKPCSGTAQALALFDALAPVDLRFMTGEWRGEEFPTGHPLDGALSHFGWRGKRIDGPDAVHPLLFDAAGPAAVVAPRAGALWLGVPLLLRWPALKSLPLARLARHLLPLVATRRPQARLRMLEFRGAVTAAMVYDGIPVTDVFRAADRDTVLGLMEARGMAQPYFFVLRRAAA